MIGSSKNTSLTLRNFLFYGMAAIVLITVAEPLYADNTFLLQLGTFDSETLATQKWQGSEIEKRRCIGHPDHAYRGNGAASQQYRHIPGAGGPAVIAQTGRRTYASPCKAAMWNAMSLKPPSARARRRMPHPQARRRRKLRTPVIQANILLPKRKIRLMPMIPIMCRRLWIAARSSFPPTPPLRPYPAAEVAELPTPAAPAPVPASPHAEAAVVPPATPRNRPGRSDRLRSMSRKFLPWDYLRKTI